jgi:transposase
MEALSLLENADIDPATKQALMTSFQSFLAEAKRDKLKIQALTLELAHLKRIRFGRRSESLDAQQLDLFAESVDEDIGSIHAELDASEADEVATPRKPRQHAGRQPLPDHLPRIEFRHEPESCQCGACGKDLVKIGEDISEQLDVTPAIFTVHRHIRPQYACRACETVTAAPIPPAVIDGGLATPGLLSWVVISKYADHLPLYRLEQMAEREGVPLARSTLADWVGRVGYALEPLHERLKERLLQGGVLHADETPVQQLDPGRGKTHKAYLWAFRSNTLDEGPPLIVFDYQTGRSGQHARDFLGAWRGHLCVDDYSGYKALFAANAAGVACVELGCFAHARRKFYELHAANQNPLAEEVLRRIAELYAIESDGKAMSIEARQALRLRESVPKLTELHRFLMDHRIKAAPGGAWAKALDYSLKRWDALARYAQTGNLPIDNNPVEQTIRPVAIGKKNWLFAGSERAGKRAAVIQSLIGTAKLNGIDPAAWMRDTLENLPLWPNKRIDELLPVQGWKPAEA